MKQLLEFTPIVLFFIAFKLGDIYLATAVLMGATCVQMGIIYWMEKHLQVMQKITLYLILGFGALTLILHDDRFIKWKPTVLYTALALALAVALWIFKKNFLQLLLGTHLSLPSPVWMRLNIAWILYFAFMSAANAFVVLQFSTDAWVNFKLWGYAFPIVFLIGQALYVSPYIKEEEKKE